MITDTKEKASRDWGIIQKKEKDGKYYWYARITRHDGTGKKKQYLAKADNKTHARLLRDELEQKYDDRGERGIEGDKLRFREIAKLYAERKLKPAEYHGNGRSQRKVAGVRSLAPSLHYLNVLTEYFGAKQLRSINHADIEDFKSQRLRSRSVRGERSIADVNRSLELLRAILRFAQRNGWLARSPFEMGSPLISKADETKRERVLSFDEEKRLLAACTDERSISYLRDGKMVSAKLTSKREYLRAIIVTALDTAMRRGELLKLQWKDINIQGRLITVRALSSKTATERRIGITERVTREILSLWELSRKEPEDLVFGIRDNFQSSFANAREVARIEDLRFHDLRHTAITRMVGAGLPPMEIMKVSGHTQWTTFARYVNPNEDTIKRVADVLTTYMAEAAEQNQSDNDFIN